MIRRLTDDVLRHYPQVYLACHLAHPGRRTNTFQLNDRDIVLLGHLDETKALRAGELARHLGILSSTLSARLDRLETRGYLTRTPLPRDRRNVELRLTRSGAAALATTSILDSGRVTALLVQLNPRERKRAVAGLGLLARAARQLQYKYPKQRRA